jgi:exopolyphosphatase/guanosine-5'-triphosphate,3'-diphosphate pyrophosphatase
MVKAVIEIGTNSQKLWIGNWDNETWKVVHENINYSRIGENLKHKKRIERQVIERNLFAIENFIKEAVQYNSDSVSIIATQALREATNADEFIDSVKQNTGLSVVVLTEKEEAYYCYLAACQSIQFEPATTLLFDIGGGSTEIFYENKENFNFVSLPIGAVSLTEQFQLQADKKSIQKLQQFLIDKFFEMKLDFQIKKLIGMGGTVVSMYHSQNRFDENRIASHILTKKEIEEQINYYTESTPDIIAKNTGLPIRRADIILAGALLVWQLLEYAKISELEVCSSGVRFGYIIENWR